MASGQRGCVAHRHQQAVAVRGSPPAGSRARRSRRRAASWPPPPWARAGSPRGSEGSTNTSMARYISGMSWRSPAKTQAWTTPSSPGELRREAVRLLAVGAADQQEAPPGHHLQHEASGLQQLRTPFSRDQAAHEAHDGGVRGDAEGRARAAPGVGRQPRSGSKRARSMPLPRRRIWPRPRDAHAQRGLHVLVVLRQDDVRAARGHLLHRHVEAAGQRAHALVEVEAVERVHHHGHAGQARRDLAEQAGLGVVRVHDREAAPAHEPVEAHQRDAGPQGREAARHRHRPRGAMPCARAPATSGPGDEMPATP